MGDGPETPDPGPSANPDSGGLEAAAESAVVAKVEGNRSTDDERLIRARLRWRCRRGMRELDALLVGFFDGHYDGLSPADKRRFGQVLELPDPDLHAYLMGWYEPADPAMARLLERMRSC